MANEKKPSGPRGRCRVGTRKVMLSMRILERENGENSSSYLAGLKGRPCQGGWAALWVR